MTVFCPPAFGRKALYQNAPLAAIAVDIDVMA